MVHYTALVFDVADIKRKDIIFKAVNYMKQHLAAKLTLENTAQHVGFSTTYFSRVFKEEMGITFNAYLIRLRMERSKAMLLSGNLPVGEVSAAVGYEDQSYFTKVFREYTGVTPGHFRKKQGHLDNAKERTSNKKAHNKNKR